MNQINNILEIIGALYTICSVLGHLPFMPKGAATFFNKLALNLKDG